MKLRVLERLRISVTYLQSSHFHLAADRIARARAATSQTAPATVQLCSRPLHTHPLPAVGLLHNCAAPTRRQLVATLNVRTARPRAPNSRNVCRDTAVARRSCRPIVSRGNRRATACEREFDALTPEKPPLPPGQVSRLVVMGARKRRRATVAYRCSISSQWQTVSSRCHRRSCSTRRTS